MKILVCATGASFCKIAISLIKYLEQSHEIYAIFSKNAKLVLNKENNITELNFKKAKILNDDDLAQSVASGSFGIEKTIIAPCSSNTLAKIANGISDTLITRAAAISLKEKKPLILAPREMPFSTISLRQMSELSALGVIIAPPVAADYFSPENLDDLEKFFIGKWLDLLGIENNLYKRWGK